MHKVLNTDNERVMLRRRAIEQQKLLQLVDFIFLNKLPKLISILIRWQSTWIEGKQDLSHLTDHTQHRPWINCVLLSLSRKRSFCHACLKELFLQSNLSGQAFIYLTVYLGMISRHSSNIAKIITAALLNSRHFETHAFYFHTSHLTVHLNHSQHHKWMDLKLVASGVLLRPAQHLLQEGFRRLRSGASGALGGHRERAVGQVSLSTAWNVWEKYKTTTSQRR